RFPICCIADLESADRGTYWTYRSLPKRADYKSAIQQSATLRYGSGVRQIRFTEGHEFHHVFEEISCHAFVLPGLVGASAIFSTRHAQTLNSGILEIGSSARLVSWFADFLPGQ